MPVRFDNRDGLKLHIIQLNGTLSVRFTSKAHRLTEQVFQGTDAGTTEQTNAAHETAIGELLLLQGLEMYVEQVQGHLRMSFESEVGNRTTIMLFDRTGNAMSEEMLEQFLEPTPRQEPVKDKVRRGLMREVSAPKEERVPVDLGEEEDEMLKNEEDDEDEHKEENDAAPTNPLWSEGGTHRHMHASTKLTQSQSSASSPVSTSAPCWSVLLRERSIGTYLQYT
jgi:hypothetical protein